jgi:hypothetical protein
MLYSKRREFITLLGGAPAWPLAARVQRPTMSELGFLSGYPAETSISLTADRVREAT